MRAYQQVRASACLGTKGVAHLVCLVSGRIAVSVQALFWSRAHITQGRLGTARQRHSVCRLEVVVLLFVVCFCYLVLLPSCGFKGLRGSWREDVH